MNKENRSLEIEEILEQFNQLSEERKKRLLEAASKCITKEPELAVLQNPNIKLNRENKDEVLAVVSRVIKRQLELQQQEEKEQRCIQTGGHQFGNWYYHYHREFDPTKCKNGKYVWKEQWTGYCTICGFEEIRKTKPKEYDEQMQKVKNRSRERMIMGGRSIPI